jgi:deoxyuridine 5'-triphosphate nucleotidohydrolase
MFLKYKILTDEDGYTGWAPYRGSTEAAGVDLYLPKDTIILGHDCATIPLLIAFDIPVDWCLYLQPRSSTFTKHRLLSTTGVIDSDYKGTVHAQLFNMSRNDVLLKRGMRLVQVQLFQKQRIQFEETELTILDSTERKPYIGSTGV